MRNWPDWWQWELEFNPHILKRMVDRRFTESDLREMLDGATRLGKDFVPGRWVVSARHDRQPWEVIIEPDRDVEVVVVVTAYPVDRE